MFHREHCTRTAIEDIDRRATGDFGIPGLILMEHASIGIARRAEQMLADSGVASGLGRITICCGPGGNGGDGFAAARHLASLGHSIHLIDLTPTSAHPDRRTNREICNRLGIQMQHHAPEPAETAPSDLIIDAILGSGMNSPPREPLSNCIDWIEQQEELVLSVDLPSGLVADSGETPGAAVTANSTVALCIPHMGLLLNEGPARAGEVWICPIGAPRTLLPRGAPIFPPEPHRLPSNSISPLQ